MKSVRQIIGILFIFPLSLTVICGFILAFCLGLYRLAHQVAAFIARPYLEGMLAPLENFFAHDDLGKPTGNICVLFTLDGKLSLEYMRSKFLKNIVLARKSDGKLNYPELQRYWTSFGSYKFWQSDVNFDVKKPVRELDYEFGDSNIESIENSKEENLKQIFTRLQVHPWQENQSPWEMLLIPNHESEDSSKKSSLIFRLHHALGDGYTIQNLLLKLLQDNHKETGPCEKDRVKMSPWQQCKFAIAAVYQLAVELMDVANQFSLDKHDWMGHTKDPACNYFTTWTEGIDVDLIKSIKRENGVSFNAVVISAVMNTFKRRVKDAGLKLPEVITAFFPVPLPNPPSGLRVHSSACLAKFSLGGGNSALERLVEVENIRKGIGRLLPGFIFNATKLYGMFPSLVIKRSKVYGLTIGFTSIPGPQDVCIFGGLKLERVLSNFPTGPGDFGNVELELLFH